MELSKIHQKECGDGIAYLVLKYNHDKFIWSQEVLIVSVRIIGLDPHIDLEKNRIDAVIPFKNVLLKTEHKFIGLLTKRKSRLTNIIDKIKKQIVKKELDLIIISTLTNKQMKTNDFLFKNILCLHVISITSDFMNATESEKISEIILNKIEMDLEEDEDMISPDNAKILVVLEHQQKYIDKTNADLKLEIGKLKEDNKELKEDNKELKEDNKELKEEMKDLSSKIDKLIKLIEKN